MNERPLIGNEAKNLAVINQHGCNSVLLFLTKTGLQKSILDATEPMRRLFAGASFHDFSIQRQGAGFKIVKRAFLINGDLAVETVVSLYRPQTKKGDPRMWVSGLTSIARPDDVCAVFLRDDCMYVLNLTRADLRHALENRPDSPVSTLFRRIGEDSSQIAAELLGHLRDIAAYGPIPSACEGSTAIGRSIEAALGIKINSSREPDYKGIELKSGRSSLIGRQNRRTLFACVPDWTISALKSSAEILNRYGYARGSEFKLYCTVSARAANSQGLQLEVEEARSWLREVFTIGRPCDVCIWPLSLLHTRLLEKHRETFWVSARTIRIRSREHFVLESVTHTASPSTEHFDRLLSVGSITLDHLIKRTQAGGAREKGPLFKIEKDSLPELFLGLVRSYSLDI